MQSRTVSQLSVIGVSGNLFTLGIVGIYAYSLWDISKRGISVHNVLYFAIASLFTLAAVYSLSQLPAG